MPNTADLLTACLAAVGRGLEMCDAAPRLPWSVQWWSDKREDAAEPMPPDSESIFGLWDSLGFMVAQMAEPGTQCAAFIAAAVNLMRPALEDYQRRLTDIKRALDGSPDRVWDDAVYEPRIAEIAAVLVAAGLMEGEDEAVRWARECGKETDAVEMK
jgi:hypothetical protein